MAMRCAIALCLLLGACATRAQPTTVSGDWQVLRIAGDTPNAPAPTVRFADGQVSGDAGCNRFSGPYHLSPTGITIGPLASTKRACLDAARGAQEVRFLDALQHARTLVLSGGRLMLDGAGGELALAQF
jgi:heat shock protein HslJ